MPTRSLIRRAASLFVALGLAGCGSVCSHLDAAERRAFAGNAECVATQGSAGATTTVRVKRAFASSASCVAALSSCSDADQQALEAYAKCLEGVSVQPCTTGSEQVSVQGILNCAAGLGGLSAACLKGVSGI